MPPDAPPPVYAPDYSGDDDAAGQVPAGGRHCWVLAPPHSPQRTPALLVQWRRGDLGWEGRVTYVATIGGSLTVLDMWLPASRLEPA